MIKQIFHKTIAVLLVTLAMAACTKDLDREPFYDATSASVYQDFNNYKLILAKLYAGIAVSGQQGPAGKPDISGIDEGFSSYWRQYWQLQELTTDEAVIGWNDGTIAQLHYMTWTPANEFIGALYNRFFYQIALCNEFIRETSDDKLSGRGIGGANLEDAKKFRSEARFLRALSYYHAMDLFGNVPFVTEQDAVGSFFPRQISRTELFNYIESELLGLETELTAAKQNEYGRADAAAVWSLLAKMYLNSEVYTTRAKYTEAISYASKVINAGFTLQPDYSHLFLADNNNSPEIIFPIVYDGLRIKSYGGMTYLVHAPVGGNMSPADFGINGGWSGLRTTKNVVNLFPDPNATADKRGMFHTSGQSIDVTEIPTFTDGYPITKFRNVTSTGVKGSDPAGDFPDTDFPMFRLADIYLIYAEAVLRGGSGGDRATALQYINALRQRAYGNASGNINDGQLTLDFILDERGRELNWEATRRTDLIRFGKFTSSSYVWPWKGQVLEGKGVEDYRTLFPIPSSDLTANPNLHQNPGY
ncbi:MAG: RagB/SusD family nutrient uptake outer membrane protein [Saprospiraceae bacterium]